MVPKKADGVFLISNPKKVWVGGFKSSESIGKGRRKQCILN